MAHARHRGRPSATLSKRQTRRSRLSVVGLFAGVGGIELGLELAGHRTVLLCEVMPEARAVLRRARRREDEHRSFVRTKIVDDVTSRDFARLLPDRFDVLTAGFPCQDLSQVGRTAGIDGERSGLIGHVLRVLARRKAAQRPTWIVLENVPFMRHLAGGEAMEVILTALGKLGYSWAYREINTLAFGLPHRRKRLFIVACRNGAGDPRDVLLGGANRPKKTSVAGPGWTEGRACGFYWTEGNTGIGWADDAIPTLKGGSSVGIPSPPSIVLPGGDLVLPTLRDAERLQGFPADWTLPAAELLNGKGERLRWSLVGNAVSVPVAEWVGERLANGGTAYDPSDDEVLLPFAKWPQSAWQMSSRTPRFVSRVNDSPLAAAQPMSLLKLLRKERIRRTPLSTRATAGFLSRFRASNLLKRDPDHRQALIEVLERHLSSQD